MEIDPAQLDAFKSLPAEEIQASVRSEPGALMLHAVAMRDEPTQIRLLEEYADQPAYEAHLQSPHFLRYKAWPAAMVLSLRLFETDPIVLRTKD